MPELPEVETIAAGVNQRVQGDVIQSLWTGAKKEPFKTSAAEMQQEMAGRRIIEVRRVGKHIVFDLGSSGKRTKRKEAQWIVHLGMTGRLLVSSADAPLAPHTHAIAALTSGRELRFVDPRRFGRLSYQQLSGEADREAGFQGSGREPLTISLPEFTALFKGRRTPIKAALLNQKLLHGVGNIYADESLFRAGIRPRRMAGRLPRADLERLYASIRSVLQEAIRLGGSSISDYVDADGERGFFQLEHKVYLRTGEPCLDCRTPIKRILVGGRGTHFCPTCQS